MTLGNMRETRVVLFVSSALIIVTAISAVVSERHAALAQPASPTDHPAGILGAKDHRVRVPTNGRGPRLAALMSSQEQLGGCVPAP